MGQSPFELHFKRFCSKFPFQKPSHFCWAYNLPPSVMPTKKVWNLTHPQIPPLSPSTKTHIIQHWKKLEETWRKKKRISSHPHHAIAILPPLGSFFGDQPSRSPRRRWRSASPTRQSARRRKPGRWWKSRRVWGAPRCRGSGWSTAWPWVISLSWFMLVYKAHEHHEPYISQLYQISCMKHS